MSLDYYEDSYDSDSNLPQYARISFFAQSPYIMTKERIIVGRNSAAGLVDIDVGSVSFVSRRHLELTYSYQKLKVKCLGKNGIFIDNAFKSHSCIPYELPIKCTLRFPSTDVQFCVEQLIGLKNNLSTNKIRAYGKSKPYNRFYSDCGDEDDDCDDESPEIKRIKLQNEEIIDNDHNTDYNPLREVICGLSDGDVDDYIHSDGRKLSVSDCEALMTEDGVLMENLTNYSIDTNGLTKDFTLDPIKPNVEMHHNGSGPLLRQTATLDPLNNERPVAKYVLSSVRYSTNTEQFVSSGNRIALYDQDDLTIEHGSDTQKPPYSYAQLIVQAVSTARDRQLTLNGIYNYISKNYPYFKAHDKGWQNSVRHNLSLNRYFIKVPRGQDEPGKGSFWRVDPTYESKLVAQAFRKRRLRNNGSSGMISEISQVIGYASEPSHNNANSHSNNSHHNSDHPHYQHQNTKFYKSSNSGASNLIPNNTHSSTNNANRHHLIATATSTPIRNASRLNNSGNSNSTGTTTNLITNHTQNVITLKRTCDINNPNGTTTAIMLSGNNSSLSSHNDVRKYVLANRSGQTLSLDNNATVNSISLSGKSTGLLSNSNGNSTGQIYKYQNSSNTNPLQGHTLKFTTGNSTTNKTLHFNHSQDNNRNNSSTGRTLISIGGRLINLSSTAIKQLQLQNNNSISTGVGITGRMLSTGCNSSNTNRIITTSNGLTKIPNSNNTAVFDTNILTDSSDGTSITTSNRNNSRSNYYLISPGSNNKLINNNRRNNNTFYTTNSSVSLDNNNSSSTTILLTNSNTNSTPSNIHQNSSVSNKHQRIINIQSQSPNIRKIDLSNNSQHNNNNSSSNFIENSHLKSQIILKKVKIHNNNGPNSLNKFISVKQENSNGSVGHLLSSQIKSHSDIGEEENHDQNIVGTIHNNNGNNTGVSEMMSGVIGTRRLLAGTNSSSQVNSNGGLIKTTSDLDDPDHVQETDDDDVGNAVDVEHDDHHDEEGEEVFMIHSDEEMDHFLISNSDSVVTGNTNNTNNNSEISHSRNNQKLSNDFNNTAKHLSSHCHAPDDEDEDDDDIWNEHHDNVGDCDDEEDDDDDDDDVVDIDSGLATHHSQLNITNNRHSNSFNHSLHHSCKLEPMKFLVDD